MPAFYIRQGQDIITQNHAEAEAFQKLHEEQKNNRRNILH